MALRINADDLGYSAHRDAGIFECARRGAIHSASLMVTGATGEEAARRALEMGLPLGLHLNLTEGTPLTDAAALVDETGRMRYKMDFWPVPRTDAWSKAVYAEACAQLDVFSGVDGRVSDARRWPPARARGSGRGPIRATFCAGTGFAFGLWASRHKGAGTTRGCEFRWA